MSSFVPSRVLSAPTLRFAECVEACRDAGVASYGLAELNTFLSGLSRSELSLAITAAPTAKLTPYIANYVAAMVEYACQKRHVSLPAWVRSVEPLSEPVFASALQSLRLHLLTNSPPPFRRRNIFIDSSLGDRV